MAYRKTEKVRAHKEAQLNLIVASAIDVAARDGLSAITSRAIAFRAGISAGLVFHYFPDMAELIARVEATLMVRDVDAMRTAAKAAPDAVGALVAALRALFSRMHVQAREIASLPDYARAVAVEIERLLRPIAGADPADCKTLARAVLGALREAAAAHGPAPKRERMALLFVLRGIGASTADQRRAELA